jgi:hypothetical protein
MPKLLLSVSTGLAQGWSFRKVSASTTGRLVPPISWKPGADFCDFFW